MGKPALAGFAANDAKGFVLNVAWLDRSENEGWKDENVDGLRRMRQKVVDALLHRV